MDPNSTDVTTRPAPPGGRRRNAYSNQPNALNEVADESSLCASSSQHPSGISSSDTELTVRPMGLESDHDAQEQHHPSMSHADPDASIISSTTYKDEPQPYDDLEHALAGVSRTDLLLALRRAKEEMDRLDSVVSSQALEIESLHSLKSDLSLRLGSQESELSSLNNLVAQREARVDELSLEQGRMEDEIYKKLGVLERLKARAEDNERKLADSERKASEAIQAAEKEREYYRDQEALLSGQNARLTKEAAILREENTHLRDTVQSMMAQFPEEAAGQGTREQTHNDQPSLIDPPATASPSTIARTTLSSPMQPNTRHRAPSSPQTMSTLRPIAVDLQQENLDALTEELTQVRKTLSSQDAALTELRNSLTKERNRSLELENEKAELENMLTGNTLERLMKASHSGQDDSWPGTAASETDESSQCSESEKASANDIQEEDDVPDVPVTPKNGRPDVLLRSRRGPRSSSAAHRRRKRSMDQIPEALGDELQQGVEEVGADHKAELARLRHENKNLTMYISKILNRILSMEGFERVLAADGTSSNGDTFRQAKKQPRHSVLPMLSRSTPVNEAASWNNKKTRRQSAGILGFARSASTALTTGATSLATSEAVETPPATSNESDSRKVQGRASVDWRSLRLPWSSSSSVDHSSQHSQNFRSFALSSSPRVQSDDHGEADTPDAQPPAMQRTLSIDEDETERRRARALLETQGLTVPDHQLTPISPRPASNPYSTSSSTSGLGAFFSRVLPAGVASAGGHLPKTASVASSSTGAEASGMDEGSNPIPNECLLRQAGKLRPSHSQKETPILDNVGSKRSTGRRKNSFLPGAESNPGSRCSSVSVADDEYACSGPNDLELGARCQASTTSHVPDVSARSVVANSSIAGDESYAFPRGEADDDSMEEKQTVGTNFGGAATEGGWRRALKRMSLLGGETAPNVAQERSEPSTSTAVRPPGSQ